MSYFVIYGTEDGLKVVECATSDSLKDLLKLFDDHAISFLDKVPQDDYEFFNDRLLVIKGKAIIPKPVNIVKSFEVE